MGRHKSFDPDKALDAAMHAFWARGYEATSVENLVAETGLNRASLYGTFGGKKELFLKAFDRYVDTGTIAVLDKAITPGSARQALSDHFDRLVDRACDGRAAGCFITNTTAEFGMRDEQVLEQARRALARIENAIDRLLRRAQAFGEVDADADIRAHARHLLAIKQGLQVISKVNPDRKALRQIADVALEAVFL